MDAWNAGPLSAFAAPITAFAAKSVQNGASEATSAARQSAATSWIEGMVISHGLRGSRLAATLPGIDRNRMGPSWAKTITPTRVPESQRSCTYAGSATFCIQVPTFERACPIQISRNARYDQAARIDPVVYEWGGAGKLVNVS